MIIAIIKKLFTALVGPATEKKIEKKNQNYLSDGISGWVGPLLQREILYNLGGLNVRK